MPIEYQFRAGVPGAPGARGKDGKDAYEQAVAGGYTGTEAEFNAQLAGIQSYAEQAAGSTYYAEQAVAAAQQAATAAQQAAESAEDAHSGAKSAAYRAAAAAEQAAAARLNVDSALSASSENPVQNKVIAAAIGDMETVLASVVTVQGGGA